MIALVDYGLGNITAFLNVYRRLNIPARKVSNAGELKGATHVILPGVGHFDHAMRQLRASGMHEALNDLALRRRIPFLGVCVGMQMLANGSDEGSEPGLGWIDGRVRDLNTWELAKHLPMPHMGWNEVRPAAGSRLFAQMESEARFYFLHSYCFECTRPEEVHAVTEYGGVFGCAVRRDNIYGVQFHPEKSHHFGMQLLQNFAEL